MDPFSKTVLTMNGLANSISMVDVEAAKPVATIALSGRPEAAVANAKGKVFVNLEDKAQIAEVDMVTHSVLHTWDLAGCIEPTGLAIDLRSERLFSGCHNGILVVIDAISGRNIQKVPIGLGVDAVAFDPAIQTVFTSNKEGTISVVRQRTQIHIGISKPCRPSPERRPWPSTQHVMWSTLSPTAKANSSCSKSGNERGDGMGHLGVEAMCAFWWWRITPAGEERCTRTARVRRLCRRYIIRWTGRAVHGRIESL